MSKLIHLVKYFIIFFVFLSFLSVSNVFAETLSLEEMEKKIDILTDEIEDMKMGLGGEKKRVHFHGYGEMHYNVPEDGVNKMDLHRIVFGISYDFNDWISLHSEFDFEHSFNEPEVEFGYLNFSFSDMFNLRAGFMLMPYGYLNEFHEPPLFYSVERPYTQYYLIPTTWNEGGVGIFGSLFEGLQYQIYAVSTLDANNFTAQKGIRSGRGKLREAKSEDIGGILRMSYVGLPGLKVGGSFYYGNAAQDNVTLDDAVVTMFEGDIQIKKYGFELIGLYTQTDIDEAGKISALTGEAIGERQTGWYVEGAYHLLHLIAPVSDHDVVVFVRHEEFDTQDEVASGFTADPQNDREVTTFGVAYLPAPDVSLKIDYEVWDDASSIERSDQLNLGVTWMF